jgi:hypothetical protein
MLRAKIFKTEGGWTMQVFEFGRVRYEIGRLPNFLQAVYWANFYRATFLAALVSKYLPLADRMAVN